ncbi:hypothetical protein C1708_20470 [Streptomyces sp. DH-12]|uniref:DUF397 domain-containing protein n=1 Tax=Streptomyces sp. NPDC014344 TaxID=3364871 RepID=UPI000CCE052B|nr:hypothetical protein C1708_20470 [Streptomyces sp. DH-12]
MTANRIPAAVREAGGECVECAITSTRAHVRDSKTVDGPVVTVTGSAWGVFLQALKRG